MGNYSLFLVLTVFACCNFHLASASLADSRLMKIFESHDHNSRWSHSIPVAVKKYDRNCFFSPVQCMLSSYSDQSNQVLFLDPGKRRFW